MNTRVLPTLAALAVVVLTPAPSAAAEAIVVRSSIQAAVDTASPGDTVVVPPGRYHESVTIAKNGITIRGRRGAVLDAASFAVGIRAFAVAWGQAAGHADRGFHQELAAAYADLGRAEDAAEQERLSTLAGRGPFAAWQSRPRPPRSAPGS